MGTWTRTVVIVALLAAAGAVGLAGPAAATTPAGTTNNACYQSPSAQNCDNTDPYDTDCANGSYVANSVPVAYGDGSDAGYIQNWYSPHCGTNWARFDDTSGESGLGTVETCLGTVFDHCTADYSSTVFPSWSDQLYAPTTQATAYGWFTLYSDGMPAGAGASGSATA